MSLEWINNYSTYFLSRYSKEPKVVVECENENCKKKFATNIGRKRCSKSCAKKVRKQNNKSLTQ